MRVWRTRNGLTMDRIQYNMIPKILLVIVILLWLIALAKAQVTTTSLTIISPVDCLNCTWEIVNNTINVWV